MEKFGMVGKLTSAPENRDKLVDILTRGIDFMQSLQGCHLYVISKDVDDAGTIWIMELWESKEAHDDSLTKPEVRALINEAMPLLTGSPDGASLIPVVGKGL